MSDPLDINAALEGFDGERMPTEVNHRIEGALMIARRYGMDPQYAIENQDSIDLLYDLTPEDYEKIRSTSPLSRNILGKEPIRQGGGALGDVVQSGALGASDAAWASTEGAFGLLEESAKVNKTKQIGEELKRLGRSPTSNILFLEKQLKRQDLDAQKRSEYQTRLEEAQNDPERQRIYQELSAINPTEFVATVAGAFREVATEQRAYNEQYYTDRINPEFADSYAGKIAKGFGQMGFYIPAGVTGVGGMGAILSGSYQEAVDDYFQSQGIDKAMATDEQRAEAARVGFMYALPASLLERAGLGPILSRVFNGSTGKMTIGAVIKRLSASGLEGFVSEGGTEAAQQILQNTIARLSEYDPDREITAGVLESFIVGGFVGATGASGTQSLNELADYRVNLEQNPRRTPLKLEAIPEVGAGEISPDAVVPTMDGFADGINAKLIDKEFSMIGKRLSEEDIQGDPDPGLIRLAFVEGDAQAQEQYNALRRPTYAEAQAAQEAAKTEEQKQREADEAVLQIDGEPDAFAIQMKNAFNLTDKEAVTVSILIDATGLPREQITAESGKAPEGPLAKGMVQFTADGKALVKGFETADVSTAIHESLAHPARRWLLNREVAQENRLGISDEDIRVAEEWAGAVDGDWTLNNNAPEEKFARGFERYLRDGKSPNARLAKVFEAMSQWLKQIYEKLKGSPVAVRISPEMRQVFDNLVSRQQYLNNLKRIDPATLLGAERIQAVKQQGGDAEAQVRAFEGALDQLIQGDSGPLYQMGEELTPEEQAQIQQELDAEQNPEAQQQMRREAQRDLNREESERFPAETEQERNVRLRREAEQRRTGQRAQLVDALQEFERMVQELPLPVRGKLQGFATLATKVGPEAQRRYLAERREQIRKVLSDYLIKEERDRTEKLVKKLEKQIREAKAGKRKLTFYADGVEEFLQVVTIKRPQDLAYLEKMRALAQERMESGDFDGENVDPETALAAWDAAIAEQQKRSIYAEDITLAELKGIRADLESIVSTGRTARMREQEFRKAQRDKNAAEIVKEINAPDSKVTVQRVGKYAQLVKDMGGSMMRPEKIIEAVTGRRDSTFKNAVFEPLFNAESRKILAIEALKGRVAEIMNEDGQARTMGGETLTTINGHAITVDEGMAIYAYSQNERGMAHLESTVLGKVGSGEVMLDEKNVARITDALTPSQKRIVDRMIDYFDTEQYQRLNEVFYRMFGTAMPKEQRYFPIVNLDRTNAYVDVLTDYVDASTHVNRGMTKGRTGSTKPFEKLSFYETAVKGAVNAEHMIAYGEALKEVNAMLNQKDVRTAMKNASPQAMRELRFWLGDVARGRMRSPNDPVNKVVEMLRRNASTALMGLNVFVALKQPASLFPALRQGPTGRILRTSLEFSTNWAEAYRAISEARQKSPFLRARANRLTAELNEMMERGQVRSILGHKKTMDAFRDLSFAPMQFVDGMTAGTVWVAQYRESLENGATEAQAIKAADTLVRNTQSTNDLLNAARVYRSGGMVKALFTFTTDINMAFNNLIADYKRGDRTAMKLLASVGMYWMMPALWMVAINALRDWSFYSLGDDDREKRLQDDYLMRSVGGEFIGQSFGAIPLLGSGMSSLYYRATGDAQRAYFAGDVNSVAWTASESLARGKFIDATGFALGVPGYAQAKQMYELLVDEED
ncbi:MAG: hypothetical protein Q7Q73_07505 [Verrucomicrobiota bacterium JB024]|nr:hypothetical protein [Verrucomicrobiota bacterium JB024]